MKTFKDFPRFREKVALVGFAPTTRQHIPFGDDSYEIWTVNEAGNTALPSFEWVKRFDRLFQMHPRWDFSRKNNTNDPNYYHWLRNESAPCVMCNATGKIGEQPCPVCKNGTYYPPETRDWPKVIYMQEAYEDIPNSVAYPLEYAIKLNPMGRYFDSSVSYMLQLACMMNYKEILVVGFEMAAQTEYFYQRANFEMLVGYWKGQGKNIVIPKESTLLHGPLYGYENMKTGYRQNLDMRLAVLQNEYTNHSHTLALMEGEMQAWKKIAALSPLTPEQAAAFTETQSRYGKQVGLVNLVKGAQYETENLRKLYDTYFMGNAEDGKTTVREDMEQYVKTVYGTE
jgi:hypothetical protein